MNQLSLNIAQFSMAGRKDENEDFHGAIVPIGTALKYKGAAVVIADGISASDAGKEASECCVANFLSDYYSTPTSWSVKQSSGKVLTALNSWLFSQGQRDPLMAKGLVSTLSILIIKSHTAHIFHVGDSRVYRWRGGVLEQLTHDHRYYTSATNHYLTRAMGADLHLDLDYVRTPVEVGDQFFLSTDGVHDYLTDRHICDLLEKYAEQFDKTPQYVVQEAFDNGSLDNITCQLVTVDSLEQEDADEAYERLKQLPFPPPLNVGCKLDGYEISEEIYASSRSQLYLAKNIKTGEQVALKTPSPNYEDEPAYIERFICEEWVGRRVENKHLMRILEPPQDRKFLYYISEYIQGSSLARWIEHHPKPEIGEVLVLVDGIIKGVRALHRKETLHQDLKPDNIMLTEGNTVKIVDFGSVRVAGIQDTYSVFGRETLLGTEQYTAPEYLSAGSVSIKSDLYAIGVIVYEMLTGGKHPYGDNASAANVHKRKYIPASRFNKMVTPWIDGALKRATRIDPRMRYDSLSEFWNDLEHPNPRYAEYDQQPLMEREPVRFWQIFFVISLMANFYLLFLVAS